MTTQRPLRLVISNNPIVALIGDVHAGRKFRTNVPLNRLGDREATVYDDLWDALKEFPEGVLQHFILLGDLFDKFQVDNNTLLKVHTILTQSAKPNVHIHVLRGNHDISRDLTLSSSFDVLACMLEDNPRVHFYDADRPMQVLRDGDFFIQALPYSSLFTATEMAEMLPRNNGVTYIVGHWDYTAHGEDTHNVAPMEVFARKGVAKVFSGHIHKPQEHTSHGIPIRFIGSLQPYAHGEEMPDETLYQTKHLAEVEELLAKNDNHFEDVNLRVLTTSKTPWTAPVPNCLSFQVKVLADNLDEADLSDMEVGYEEFSTVNIINKNLDGVGEELVNHIHQRLDHYRDLED